MNRRNTGVTRYRHELKQEISPADVPLCSYSYITVNGSDWGELYKPDSSDMGGRTAFQD